MLPRVELFKRWAFALWDAADCGGGSRLRNGIKQRISTLDLLSRVSRWKEHERDSQRSEWERVVREKFSVLPDATDREKMALRLPLARAHDKAMAARQVAMDLAIREAFVERISVDRWSLRSNIIRLVDRGEMSPDQAEAWAATFGWKPLAGWADPTGFDPVKEVAWSLPMAAAWIRWRDVDEVRRRWSAYIEPSTQWVDVSNWRDGSRHAVWPIKDRGYYEVYDFEERENDPLTSTKTEMLLALSSGRLQARGYRDGRFIEIPAAEWTVLKLVGFSGTDDAPWIRNGIHKVMTPDGEHLAYDAVCVWREQILAAFPAPGQEGGKERYQTGGPGRPSAIQFVEAEADRRRQSGEASPMLAREAIYLHGWCKREHSGIVAPTAKTIEGRIRVAHNAWKSAVLDTGKTGSALWTLPQVD